MIWRYCYAWILVGLIATTDAIWAWAAGVDITGLWPPALFIVLLSGIAAFYHATGRDARIASFAACATVLIGFTNAAAALSYLALTIRLQTADAVFAHLDAMLGFDWIAWSN